MLDQRVTLVLLGILLKVGYGFDPSGSFLSSTSPLLSDPELVNLYVDEVHDLKLDLTRSFIAEHSRRKREILRYSYEVTLSEKSEGEFETSGQSLAYPCLYRNQTLLLQDDGIYDVPDETRSPSPTKVTGWKLDRGEAILKTTEWNGILFILTANGHKTKVYTLTQHGSAYKLQMKQEMRSEAYPTAATFFVHAFDLYLIVAMDNKAHSLTISPIYRWSRTYMDQIHEIQTRGAVDVVSFAVSTYTYIAIAQAEDAAGNQEVGTLVIRIYGKGEVEKVQLLWSIHAVSVSYVRFLEENFLVIGQRDEASICYWFGGYHFVYWQSLPGLLGSSVFLDSFILPDHEPLLLGSTDSAVHVYTRQKMGNTREISSLNLTSVLYQTVGSDRIVDARFIERRLGLEDTLCLAVSLQYKGKHSIKILPLALKKVAVADVQIHSEDEVSGCMSALRKALDDNEPALGQLEGASPLVLTKSGDWRVDSNIIAKTSVTVPSAVSLIDVAVEPVLSNKEDRCENSPSEILSKGNDLLDEYKDLVGKTLENVLVKSKPGDISAHFQFRNALKIRNLQISTGLELENLNGHPWIALETQVLRRNQAHPQVVTGNWEMETLKAIQIETGARIGNGFISDFLLTTNQPGKTREIQGDMNFIKDIDVENLLVGPYVTLNGIPFGDIAKKSDRDSEIRGYKTGLSVNGGPGLDVGYVNGIKLSSWYEDTLKIEGVQEEWCSGNKTFDGNLNIKNLTVDTINGRDWNEFAASVLLNGVDQDMNGDFACGNLKVTHLQVRAINQVVVDDWMTTSTDQMIRSDIHVKSNAHFRQNLDTDSINGIHLADAILRNETEVRISGPLEFIDLTLGNLTFAAHSTLNSLKISDASQLRKKHVYSCTGDEFILDGNVEVADLYAGSLNGLQFETLKDSYWQKDIDNRIVSDFSFASAKLQTDEFDTGTLNGLRLEQDIVRLSTNGTIATSVEFSADAVVHGPVMMEEGAAINSYDISEVVKDIVRISDSRRRIRGRKEFSDLIELRGGLDVKEVNGIYIKNDLIYLDSYARQDLGKKQFEAIVAQEIVSDVDITVGGLVNGLKLKNIEESSVYLDADEPLIIQSEAVFENPLSAASLFVRKDLNGLNVGEILENVIPLDEEVELKRPLTVAEGKIHFMDTVEVTTINEISPRDYLSSLASRTKDSVFLGKGEFAKVTVDGSLDCNYLNNINLTELERYAFSKTKHQLVTGPFTFQELYSEGNLIADRISNIPISHIVRTDRDARIDGGVIFKTTRVTLEDSIKLDGHLNSHKIEEVAQRLQELEGKRTFGHVHVTGNLTWDVSDPSSRRLSYLLSNAVTTDTPQTIRGKVTFAGDLEVKELTTSSWIKGVDLGFIVKDSVYQSEPAEISGKVVFEKEVLVKSRSASSSRRLPVVVEHHLDASKVNDVLLEDLFIQVVRRDDTRRVYGRKTFKNGVSVPKLNVYGEIGGVNTKDLMTLDDQRKVDTVTITGISISGDLHFNRLNDHPFLKYFPDRITLEEDHDVKADWVFHDSVTVKNCEFNSINNLHMSNVFLRKSFTQQQITGEKCFNQLVVDGSLEDVRINGLDLNSVRKAALHLERDEVIERHITFLDTVHLTGPLNLTGGVNEYAIDAVAEAFTSKLEDLVENSLVSQETKEKTDAIILDLERAQQNQAFWLDYVEEMDWLVDRLEGPTVRVESFTHPDEQGKVTIGFHGESEDTGGALPSGCVCTTIDFFQFGSSLASLGKVQCVRVFDVTVFGGDISYTVYSHVLSYNKTCSRRESGETFVSISQNQHERYQVKGSRSLKPDWSVGRMDESGFISDVKAFVVGSKKYLVIAQSYDPRARTHRANVLVFDTSYERLENVQTIESHGAKRMALDLVNGKWILIVGNAGEEDETGVKCPTESGIYQWSTSLQQFVLIRNVATIALIDVSLMSIDRSGYFVEAFAIFAQNAPGTLAVYKYRETEAGETFEFLQEIEVDGGVSGIESFVEGDVSYSMVAGPSAGVRFYQQVHLEGFKLALSVGAIKKPSDIGYVVNRRGEIFFPVASNDPGVRGVLTQGILQGRLNSYFRLTGRKQIDDAYPS